ncbi:hypothetical protein WJX84_010495 [Apatococcus fuscideae]|uniref:Calponin-homology (CH) domain-containing protein n=1 Tax=Apatococcus fuscideae TaxID=2026836 RepID=A0AAW1T5S3_9CHLO
MAATVEQSPVYTAQQGFQSTVDSFLQHKAREWMSEFLQHPLPDIPLANIFKSGLALGHVAKRVQVLRGKKEPATVVLTAEAMENRRYAAVLDDTHRFLQVCSDLGVAPVVMPEISDILQGRKTSAVCSALAYLASACVQAGIVGVPRFASPEEEARLTKRAMRRTISLDQAQSPDRSKPTLRTERDAGSSSFRARLSALEALGQQPTPHTPPLRRASSRLVAASTPASTVAGPSVDNATPTQAPPTRGGPIQLSSAPPSGRAISEAGERLEPTSSRRRNMSHDGGQMGRASAAKGSSSLMRHASAPLRPPEVVLPEAGQPASPSGAGGAGQGRFPAPIRSPISPELNAASGQSVLDAAAEFEQTAIRRAKAAEARQAARTASPKARVPRSARRFEQAFSSEQDPAPSSPQSSPQSIKASRAARKAFERALAAEQDGVMGSPKRSPRGRMRGGGGERMHETHGMAQAAAVRDARHHNAARQDMSHHCFTGGEAPHAPIRTSSTPINARWALNSHQGSEIVRGDSADPAGLSGEPDARRSTHKLPGLSEHGLLDTFQSHTGWDEDPATPSDGSAEGRPGTPAQDAEQPLTFARLLAAANGGFMDHALGRQPLWPGMTSQDLLSSQEDPPSWPGSDDDDPDASSEPSDDEGGSGMRPASRRPPSDHEDMAGTRGGIDVSQNEASPTNPTGALSAPNASAIGQGENGRYSPVPPSAALPLEASDSQPSAAAQTPPDALAPPRARSPSASSSSGTVPAAAVSDTCTGTAGGSRCDLPALRSTAQLPLGPSDNQPSAAPHDSNISSLTPYAPDAFISALSTDGVEVPPEAHAAQKGKIDALLGKPGCQHFGNAPTPDGLTSTASPPGSSQLKQEVTRPCGDLPSSLALQAVPNAAASHSPVTLQVPEQEARAPPGSPQAEAASREHVPPTEPPGTAPSNSTSNSTPNSTLVDSTPVAVHLGLIPSTSAKAALASRACSEGGSSETAFAIPVADAGLAGCSAAVGAMGEGSVGSDAQTRLTGRQAAKMQDGPVSAAAAAAGSEATTPSEGPAASRTTDVPDGRGPGEGVAAATSHGLRDASNPLQPNTGEPWPQGGSSEGPPPRSPAGSGLAQNAVEGPGAGSPEGASGSGKRQRGVLHGTTASGSLERAGSYGDTGHLVAAASVAKRARTSAAPEPTTPVLRRMCPPPQPFPDLSDPSSGSWMTPKAAATPTASSWSSFLGFR